MTMTPKRKVAGFCSNVLLSFLTKEEDYDTVYA
jgi:hypothetical protein